MPVRILVLHGPNLPLLALREVGLPLSALNEALHGRARALAAELTVVHSQHEGGLLEALATHGSQVQGVVVSPGVLAHTSYALREALQLVARPAVEVQLVRPSKAEPWRATSLLEGVVQARVVGGGLQAYLEALDRLVLGERVGAVGEEEARAAVAPAMARAPAARAGAGAGAPAGGHGPLTPAPSQGERGEVRKTLGRKAEPPTGLTRVVVRKQVAARLAGELSMVDLATWARARWLEVQEGGPVESGQRELLEQSLQALALSALPSSRMTDEQLVELMARLDR